MDLIVTEKPSVARDLARVLMPGGGHAEEGFIQSPHIAVVWAFGHLLQLAEPEVYQSSWKTWSLDTLPIFPEVFRYTPLPRTKRQLSLIRERIRELTANDRLINACDAGREGELIFRRIAKHVPCRAPVLRLWLSENTPAIIRDAYQTMKPAAHFDPLAAAAESRSQADWLVGINGTRAFTVTGRGSFSKTPLSIGRVQTPTLSLIVQREEDIRRFKKTPYWTVDAVFEHVRGTYPGTYWPPGARTQESSRLPSLQAAETVANAVTGQDGLVDSIQTKMEMEKPPLLFNLADLQRRAQAAFGWNAAYTLSVAQSAYEKGWISYPRTDSRYISRQTAQSIQDRLKGYGYTITVQPDRGRSVSDAGVTDHHALIPTMKLASGTSPAAQLAQLVAKRTAASFHKPHRYEVTRIDTKVLDHHFVSTVQRTVEPGWRAIEPEHRTPSESPWPDLSAGDRVAVQKVEVNEHETKPPSRYSDATLLSAMEKAGTQLSDHALSELMKESGIGTAATRAQIIETLITRGYIEREKRTLRPTSRGEMLLAALPDSIKSAELTAKWEERLRAIESGSGSPKEFLSDIMIYTKELVESAQRGRGALAPEKELAVSRVLRVRCPRCQQQDLGMTDSTVLCPNPSCTFRMFRTFGKKVLGPRILTELLTTGTTKKPVSSLQNRQGRKFASRLAFNPDEAKIRLFTNESPEQLGPPLTECPYCTKTLNDLGRYYCCEDRCLTLWKTFLGRAMSNDEWKTLIQQGQTEWLSGFRSKRGKSFTARLTLSSERKIMLEFPNRTQAAKKGHQKASTQKKRRR